MHELLQHLKIDKLPRCSECGWSVEFIAKTGRTREVLKDVVVKIPDDFETPVCVKCGEEFMIPEISDVLDNLLIQSLLDKINDCSWYVISSNQEGVEIGLTDEEEFYENKFLSQDIDGRQKIIVKRFFASNFNDGEAARKIYYDWIEQNK